MTHPRLFPGLVSAALLAAMAVPALAQTAIPTDEARLYDGAKKEGGLVEYISGPLEPLQLIATEFEKKYPGVKVQLLRYVGVAQYQRFMQETQAKQYIADVVSNSDEPSVVDLANRGLLADWKIPTYDRLPPTARIKTYAYSAYLLEANVAYNPNKVTPDEVKILASGWNGILDPRFKGRIATTDQKNAGAYAMLQMFLDPKYEARFGEPFLTALAAQDLAVYSDPVIVVDRVIAGENDIGYWATEAQEFVKWAQGAPIRWVHPKPTPVLPGSWFAISAFAPHPYAARLFENWIMGEDGAKALQDKYGSISNLSGYTDQRPVAKQTWYDPITETYPVDFDVQVRDGDRNYATWMKLLKKPR